MINFHIIQFCLLFLLYHVLWNLQFDLFEIQPKFGGQIIDIVSRDLREPAEKAEALDAVRDTILEIVLIVIIGYLFS
jgi:hypothetical protein